MAKEVQIGDVIIGGNRPLALIAGPCMLESKDLACEIAGEVKNICLELGMPFIFKASFDKANRLSVNSKRGPGIEDGLRVLGEIKREFDVPVLTDVHESSQVEETARVVDILQIPAFLCRQTDLVLAAAMTGKPVNIKKGQFLSPADMGNIIMKATSTGNEQVTVTERGVTFGYGNLIVDMRSFPIMSEFGYPVIFDATHSVQRPGGLGNATGGDREFVPHLVRAACAVGIDALFLEVHPHPERALSDAATMLPLKDLRRVLLQAREVSAAVKRLG
ncbi:MAG TPA: 3-deoxy-8-phosphooctulonate synthase [Armatimonadota bacterium]|jgi:2-dehydro-3-deoxyphosphooctonate aldolase (KDO 8-P synthase)